MHNILEIFEDFKQTNGSQDIQTGSGCSVVRGSKEVRIQSNELVRGDLVWIRRSDRVAADCRLIYTKDFKIETSWISGETEWIDYSAETQKSVGVFEANNLVFAGSSCRTGEALGLVIRTGNSMVNECENCRLVDSIFSYSDN